MGTSTPTIAPTSGAKQPPALTTCSALIVPFSVTTSHSPPFVLLISRTRLKRLIVDPFDEAICDMVVTTEDGST